MSAVGPDPGQVSAPPWCAGGVPWCGEEWYFLLVGYGEAGYGIPCYTLPTRGSLAAALPSALITAGIRKEGSPVGCGKPGSLRPPLAPAPGGGTSGN